MAPHRVIGVVVYPLAFYSSMHFAGVAIGNVVSLGTGPISPRYSSGYSRDDGCRVCGSCARDRDSGRRAACGRCASGGFVLGD